MMDFFQIFTPMSFFLVAAGVFIGIIFGAIPGLTATMAIAVFLPVTFAMNINQGICLLLGLYVGGISGGLIPAGLLNIPGTPSSICTTFDAYPMSKKGHPIKAMKIGITAAFIGSTIALLALYFFTPVLASFAISFTSVETCLLIVFALTVLASISEGSLLAGLFSGFLGVFVSLIGILPINNQYRLVPSFLHDQLASGFALLPVLIGLFAIPEVLREAEKGMKSRNQKINFKEKKEDGFKFSIFKNQKVNVVRSSLIGTFIGILPGLGGSAGSITSYSQAKNFSKHPERLGTGEPEGIIASEAANHGVIGGSLVPLLALGIPGDSDAAALLGAFIFQGVQVGPLFIPNNVDLWHSIVYAIFFADIIMVILMVFSLKFFAKILSIPKHILYPIILVVCVLGSYAVNQGVMFDVWTVILFGIAGYIFTKIGISIPSFLIGFILGGELEKSFLDTIQGHKGDLFTFFTHSPIDWVLWLLIIVSFVYGVVNSRKLKRTQQDSVASSM